MFNKSLFFKIVSILLISCVLYACASLPSKPKWVTQGGSIFKDNKKALYGVGSVDGVTSEALKRTAADNRAIVEISKQVSVMSTSLMRDYMSSTSAAEEEKRNGEQYIEQTAKTFTSNVLSGIRIIDRWSDDKTTYSLAELNIDDLKSMTDNIKQLSEKTREYIKANAEKAFDKLDKEQQNSK